MYSLYVEFHIPLVIEPFPATAAEMIFYFLMDHPDEID